LQFYHYQKWESYRKGIGDNLVIEDEVLKDIEIEKKTN